MLTQNQVGPLATSTSLSSGVQVTDRGGNMGEKIVSELQPRYYENTYRRNSYSAYAGGVATSLTGTALVGLILWNGSTSVNAVLTKSSGFIAVTSATTTGLALAKGTGQPTAPTGLTAITASGNDFIGGMASQCTAYNAGTVLVAPTVAWPLLHNTAAIAVTGEDNGYSVDFEGSIIVPPQTFVAIVALGAAAGAASTFLALKWIEVPI